MTNVSSRQPLKYRKCKKSCKTKIYKFKFAWQKVIKEIDCLIRQFKASSDKCGCGCFKSIKNVQSSLLMNYFSCKRRWINILKVSKVRIAELNEVAEIVRANGCTVHTFKLLDLNFVRTDLDRQQWIQDNEMAQLAENAIVTFCITNNVGYWQGIHDIAAALVHLCPRPNIGELAAILEQLTRRHSPVLFSGSHEEVMYQAKILSQKWKVLFKYFFPGGFNELEKISDFNSLGMGLFLTLGFYRFGCAYIALSYIYVMMLNKNSNVSDLMFHELGYLATRGYMNYLSKHNENIKLVMDGNILPKSISHSNIMAILKNSVMIDIEAEEVINSSKNLYDVMGNVDCELYKFPLVYITLCSNSMYRVAPSISNLQHDCNYMQISIRDILKEKPIISSLECSFKTDIPKSGSSSFCCVRKGTKRYNSFNYGVTSNYSMGISSKIVFNYINSIRKNTYRIHKRTDDNLNYMIGSLANNANYNLIDMRSPYMTGGESLEKLLGDRNITFIKENELNSAIIASHVKQFTIWIVLTDEGITGSDNHFALESLNKGFHVMKLLCDNSITGVALLTNGYKELLLTANCQIPQGPNSNITGYLRRFIFWNSEEITVEKPQTTFSRVADVVGNITLDIEKQLVQKFSEINLFTRQKHVQGVSEIVDMTYVDTLSDMVLSIKPTKPRNRTFVLYVKLDGFKKIALFSNGSIQLDGIILHPYHYSKIRSVSETLMISTAKLLAVNYIDGIWEALPISSSVIGNEPIPLDDALLSNVDRIFDKFVVSLEVDDIEISIRSHKLNIATKVYGLSNSEKRNSLVKHWYVILIDKKEITTKLLYNERIFWRKVFRRWKYDKNSEKLHKYTVNDTYSSPETFKINYGVVLTNSMVTSRVSSVPLPQEVRGVKVFSRRQDVEVYKRTESLVQPKRQFYGYKIPEKEGTNLRLTHSNSISSLLSRGKMKNENAVQKIQRNVFVTRSSLVRRQK
ncbi:hypothetical protein BEWA_007750 [Theileria equi strain WA]|uniref:Uncharacterized protein n=1 Tax=Theileria equi strain WA TaxID=1537102 RepID=L0B2A6_THEEQ|nr:hypothetical protein BEWA_007750 [Theileria equi strain WA]AFZ81366.1 hypothetical protein BEWA_007750 [Theileria equi strain WA]|eukprot:XP_004831032.1 hypothetical protein BEWA_007750 [Theileria equi strain WA]